MQDHTGTTTIDTAWFRERMAERRLSQRGLARQLGLDPGAASLMFNGKHRMQMSEAAGVARLLGVTLDEVVKHAGIDPPGGRRHADTAVIEASSVPLVYWIDGHGEMHAAPPGRRVPIAAALPEDTIAAQARTAMSPLEHMDRWLLFFPAPRETGVPPTALGRYCALKLAGGIMTVGYLRPGYEPGTYSIHGAQNIVDARVEWAAPVTLIQP